MRVGHQVVAEGDRLGALQMGIARHDGRFVFRRAIYERLDQRFHLRGQWRRTARADTSAGRARPDRSGCARCAAFCPRHRAVRSEPARRTCGCPRMRDRIAACRSPRSSRMVLQPVDQGIGVRLWQNTGRAEHGGVRHAAGDVLPVHPAVKADGRVEIVRQTVGLPVGAPGPHLRHAQLTSFSGKPLKSSFSAFAGSFAPMLRFEKLEIHKGCLRFSNLALRQNLSANALKDLIRAFPVFYH